jgi:hypothetical protein
MVRYAVKSGSQKEPPKKGSTSEEKDAREQKKACAKAAIGPVIKKMKKSDKRNRKRLDFLKSTLEITLHKHFLLKGRMSLTWD